MAGIPQYPVVHRPSECVSLLLGGVEPRPHCLGVLHTAGGITRRHSDFLVVGEAHSDELAVDHHALQEVVRQNGEYGVGELDECGVAPLGEYLDPGHDAVEGEQVEQVVARRHAVVQPVTDYHWRLLQVPRLDAEQPDEPRRLLRRPCRPSRQSATRLDVRTPTRQHLWGPVGVRPARHPRTRAYPRRPSSSTRGRPHTARHSYGQPREWAHR
mmetsp:Transcript_43213/g.107964  ORF Transcript_43213/g.107964 Transcript_43213/m.107964 type:complete len:213 (-) Transcript_43213:17-655(-)